MGEEKKNGFPEKNAEGRIKKKVPKAAMGAAAALAGGAVYANVSQEEILTEDQEQTEQVDLTGAEFQGQTTTAIPEPERENPTQMTSPLEKEGTSVDQEDLRTKISQLLVKAQTLHNTFQNY